MMTAELINTAAFAVFAEPISLDIDGYVVELTGIYDKQREPVERSNVHSYRHRVSVKAADIDALSIKPEKNKNHTLTCAGVVYTIVDSLQHSGGIIEYTLREYD